MPCVRHRSFVHTHLLQNRPVGYSKLRVPFLFLLSSPLLFSPTTDLHWTSRGADSSHCNTPCLDWVVWLCSVINYSFKHHSSVFIHFTLFWLWPNKMFQNGFPTRKMSFVLMKGHKMSVAELTYSFWKWRPFYQLDWVTVNVYLQHYCMTE